MGMPGEKSMNFRGSRRAAAAACCAPSGVRLAVVVVLAIAVGGARRRRAQAARATRRTSSSTASSARWARCPPGDHQDQAVDGAAGAAARTRSPTCSPAMRRRARRQGIDFDALRRLLLIVLAALRRVVPVRLAAGPAHRRSSCSGPSTGCAQEVEAKLSRLPLRYIDRQPRGELLSRVTNDIDNVAQTLQQTLSPAHHLGAHGRRRARDDVLDLAAARRDRAGHRAAVGRRRRRRSPSGRSRSSSSSGRATGKLNAHIEEMYTGHSLVKVFGRQAARPSRCSHERERGALRGELQGAVHLRDHPAGDGVPRQPQLRRSSRSSAACGWRRGRMTLGDVQAFIQYSRQFTQPITQIASMMNLLQSGVASAERVFELLDAAEQSPDPAEPRRAVAAGARAGSRSRTCRSATTPDTPADRRTCRWWPSRGRRSRSSDRPAPARRRWSTCSCGSTRSTAAGSRSTASTPAT